MAMLQKAMKNGQSRGAGNIEHKTHNKNKENTTQNTENMSNMNPAEKTGG
jgi:hypothetical protein